AVTDVLADLDALAPGRAPATEEAVTGPAAAAELR
ncbi:MAG: hypothetical protein QOC94_3449, partial [Actinoplanes sp.]|nr:hypothetical protein [Actinoplanes sp.]